MIKNHNNAPEYKKHSVKLTEEQYLLKLRKFSETVNLFSVGGAIALLDEMSFHNIPITDIHYNLLFKACLLNNDTLNTRNIFRKVLEQEKGTSNLQNNFKLQILNNDSLICLTQIFIKSFDYDYPYFGICLGLLMLRGVCESFISRYKILNFLKCGVFNKFSSLLKHYQQQQLWEKYDQLENKIYFNPLFYYERDNEVLNYLTFSLGKRGEFFKIESLFEKLKAIHRMKISPELFNTYFLHLVRRKSKNYCLNVYNQYLSEGGEINSEIADSLMHLYGRSRDVDAMFSLFYTVDAKKMKVTDSLISTFLRYYTNIGGISKTLECFFGLVANNTFQPNEYIPSWDIFNSLKHLVPKNKFEQQKLNYIFSSLQRINGSKNGGEFFFHLYPSINYSEHELKFVNFDSANQCDMKELTNNSVSNIPINNFSFAKKGYTYNLSTLEYDFVKFEDFEGSNALTFLKELKKPELYRSDIPIKLHKRLLILSESLTNQKNRNDIIYLLDTGKLRLTNSHQVRILLNIFLQDDSFDDAVRLLDILHKLNLTFSFREFDKLFKKLLYLKEFDTIKMVLRMQLKADLEGFSFTIFSTLFEVFNIDFINLKEVLDLFAFKVDLRFFEMGLDFYLRKALMEKDFEFTEFMLFWKFMFIEESIIPSPKCLLYLFKAWKHQ
ncbi:hypothetical protein HDU92_001598 [Lobulomyces angularis]|nr:hypothetical protein HDU92_001598 [Lobulomyces angularis]